ncbi:uncharacterized protein LOC125241966 [Leguminivora glycinivorella]|uniref:uncharacterized protein LOC125241966 n=1 Tax=Leguminivora glycinivorella TaxID=1035111 RepID=UPI00200C12AB|nr:uncharacterized protein LOC125241966 [Leguminivora glycinivorella]
MWSVLRANDKHAFHYTPVQGLQEGDPARRFEFFKFLMHTDVDDIQFLQRILWTDESCFNREGITNLHNLHHWASKDQNPHVKRPTSFQQKFSVNVWAGVIGRRLIGSDHTTYQLD